ncbi:MAG: D-alanyl-D-alanine carboxypeptidase/D-alanyl-D-alanine-endopeptidase [Spirulinaceae cyanobacterium]
MKQPWLKSLTILALSAITTFNPLLFKAGVAQEIATLPPPNFEPIDIYVPPPEQLSDGVCPASMDFFIDAIVDTPAFRTAKWGILVESLDGQVIYGKNPTTRLIPASNTKLLTTAAALQRLDIDSARIRSSSLTSWVTTTNRDSNNNYAEILLRFIGGATAAKQSLTQLGVNPNGFSQADGSGLSRSNSISPDALVDLLQAMTRAKGSDIFYQSLPVGGVSGTLRRRFRSTAAQGKVRAKTGTLRGVRALSGYLEHPEYGRIVFSILINQPGQSGDTMLRAIDDVVVQLTKLVRC